MWLSMGAAKSQFLQRRSQTMWSQFCLFLSSQLLGIRAAGGDDDVIGPYTDATLATNAEERRRFTYYSQVELCGSTGILSQVWSWCTTSRSIERVKGDPPLDMLLSMLNRPVTTPASI
eukprot:2668492-Amphidinium_carterae.2